MGSALNDPHLNAHFAPQDLRGKVINKEMLIATLQLKLSTTQPLIGMVTRLTEQKGIDLLFDSLPGAASGARFRTGRARQAGCAVCRFLHEPGAAAFPTA